MPTLSESLKPLIAASHGIQDPGLHNTKNSPADLAVTASEYGTLQNAYDFFNRALFGGGLPQVLITLQRRAHALGYFSPDRFQRRGEIREHVHEIALNPNGFAGNTDEEILSTLVHEMVHVWQQEYGKPGRGRYHNLQWAHKMHGIGLLPSSTGKPGGAITGDSMSHYVVDGPYLTACREFLKCYRLVWESAVNADHNSDAEDEIAGTTKSPTRAKFTCPHCGLNVWAKPGALVDCHRCSVEACEHIPLVPNGTRQPETEGSAIDSEFAEDENPDGAGLITGMNNLKSDGGTEDEYSRVIDLMTQATQSASRSGICMEEYLPALVDFTTAVALMTRGEECLSAFITRMEGRLDDWRAGKFPSMDSTCADVRPTTGDKNETGSSDFHT